MEPYEGLWVRDKWDKETVHEVADSYFWDTFNPRVINSAMDVGGHIGSWSVRLKQMNPSAQIILVEPDKDNASMALMNLSRWDNTIVIQAAMKYEPGQYHLGRHPWHGAAHQLFPARYRPDADREYVPVTKLVTMEEALFEGGLTHVDLLKLDCEGAELEIIRDMTESVFARIQRIVGEIHMPINVFENQTGQRLLKGGFNVHYEPHPANPTLHNFMAWRPE